MGSSMLTFLIIERFILTHLAKTMNFTNLQFPLGANFFFPGLVLPTNFKYVSSLDPISWRGRGAV